MSFFLARCQRQPPRTTPTRVRHIAGQTGSFATPGVNNVIRSVVLKGFIGTFKLRRLVCRTVVLFVGHHHFSPPTSNRTSDRLSYPKGLNRLSGAFYARFGFDLLPFFSLRLKLSRAPPSPIVIPTKSSSYLPGIRYVSISALKTNPFTWEVCSSEVSPV